jgi:hypothetical protein
MLLCPCFWFSKMGFLDMGYLKVRQPDPLTQSRDSVDVTPEYEGPPKLQHYCQNNKFYTMQYPSDKVCAC